MGLTKLIKNRISSEWKDTFNDNVDQLERDQDKNETEHKATNKRIDNLVLNSGGDSPNEVTDARTDISGTIHDTLKDRIDAGETLTDEEIKDLNEVLTKQKGEITQLTTVIKELYSGEGSNVDIYVNSSKGNNTTADGTEEKPFKTIQAAVDGIPFLSSASFFIHVTPGAYREDVTLNSINTGSIEILGTNHNAVSANDGDTGVYVRSITFYDCRMYCAVRGITLTDPENFNRNWFIKFVRCGYGAVDNCRAALNTRNIDNYRAVSFESTIGSIYGESKLRRQNIAIAATFLSQMRITEDTYGDTNKIVARCESSIIYKNPLAGIDGEEQVSKITGGQVFNG